MTYKSYILIFSGFIWGVTAFTVEFFPGEGQETLQLGFRLGLITISSLFILTVLEIKVSKEYHVGLFLIYSYLFVFILSDYINGIDLQGIFREMLMFMIVTVLYVILSNKGKIFDFLKGIYLALILLMMFYLQNIDFTQIFDSFYRLTTALNPNGIGIMTFMTFAMSYYYYFVTKKNIHLLVAMSSFVVIFATKSRTSLLVLVVSYFLLNIYFKNRKIVATSIILLILFLLTQDGMLSSMLRLEQAEGYAGDNNIYNMTGRMDLWKEAVSVIQNNFLIGVGPQDAFVMVDGHKGTYHNAYIQNFVTVGFLGSLPIFILLFMALKNVLFSHDVFLFKILFIAGFISTFVESLFFNFGSPGGLLFLLSLLYLGKSYQVEKELNGNRMTQ